MKREAIELVTAVGIVVGGVYACQKIAVSREDSSTGQAQEDFLKNDPRVMEVVTRLNEVNSFVSQCQDQDYIDKINVVDQINRDGRISFAFGGEIGQNVAGAQIVPDINGDMVPQIAINPTLFLSDKLSTRDRAMALYSAAEAYRGLVAKYQESKNVSLNVSQESTPASPEIACK